MSNHKWLTDNQEINWTNRTPRAVKMRGGKVLQGNKKKKNQTTKKKKTKYNYIKFLK